jgi:hypothetical protein
MDTESFDAFARALATQRPRRSVLPLLGALGIAGVAASYPGGDALAKSKHRKRKKKRKKQKHQCRGGRVSCRGECLNPGEACCSASTSGINGACPPDAPLCCALSQAGGCCPTDFPVCCINDCCEEGDSCDEDGFCLNG